MLHISADQVRPFRDALQKGGDGESIMDVGYFLTWYAAVDIGFTQLFAFATGIHDYRMFDILSSKMDLRIKIEKFRAIRKIDGGIGPNLDQRLTYFDKKCRPIRNNLAHCALTHAEDGSGRYYASTLGSLPYTALGEPKPSSGFAEPILYTAQQLLGWGGWLVLFARDISAAFQNAYNHNEYEIPSPQTSLPSP